MNERLLVARFKHRYDSLAIVVAYAPINDAQDQDKTDFYETLEAAMRLTKQSDLIVCLGDFDAVMGTSWTVPGVVVLFGSGTLNGNTERLINFCAGANLSVCGSQSRRKDIHRDTWFSNDGLTKKEIDDILVNNMWRAITSYRVYR